MSGEAPCYTVVFEDTAETPSTQELRSALEKGSDEDKLDTLRRIIVATINGNPQVRIHALNFLNDGSQTDITHMGSVQPTLLMPIIQYIMPSKHKQLKKLLHFYWEVCPKYDENGKLKQEMILVVYVSLLSLWKFS